METPGQKFRRLLRDEEYLFTGGVYSPLDAQIAENVGMKSIHLSGYSVAMANGWPDIGYKAQWRLEKTKAGHPTESRRSLRRSPASVPIVR